MSIDPSPPPVDAAFPLGAIRAVDHEMRCAQPCPASDELAAIVTLLAADDANDRACPDHLYPYAIMVDKFEEVLAELDGRGRRSDTIRNEDRLDTRALGRCGVLLIQGVTGLDADLSLATGALEIALGLKDNTSRRQQPLSTAALCAARALRYHRRSCGEFLLVVLAWRMRASAARLGSLHSTVTSLTPQGHADPDIVVSLLARFAAAEGLTLDTALSWVWAEATNLRGAEELSDAEICLEPTPGGPFMVPLPRMLAWECRRAPMGVLGVVPWHAARRETSGLPRYACSDVLSTTCASARQLIEAPTRPRRRISARSAVLVVNPDKRERLGTYGGPEESKLADGDLPVSRIVDQARIRKPSSPGGLMVLAADAVGVVGARLGSRRSIHRPADVHAASSSGRKPGSERGGRTARGAAADARSTTRSTCRDASIARRTGAPTGCQQPMRMGRLLDITVNRRGLNGVIEDDIASDSQQATAKRLDELTNLFRQRLIDDSEKKRAFDALYRELARARALVDGQYLMPLIRRLIDVIDRVAAGPGELAKSVADELTDILSMYEVVQIKPGSDHFDPRLQEVAAVVEAADAEEDGTVASVRRSGWRLGSRIVRPVLVDVRRLPHQEPLT